MSVNPYTCRTLGELMTACEALHYQEHTRIVSVTCYIVAGTLAAWTLAAIWWRRENQKWEEQK
jgi:hypothetical protein